MTNTDTMIETIPVWTEPDRIPLADAERINALADAPFLFRMVARGALSLRYGRIIAILPNGEALRYEGPEPGETGVLQIHDYALADRLVNGGSLGFAEAYMDEIWSTPDLPKVLHVFNKNADWMISLFRGTAWMRWLGRIAHFWNRNTRRQAKRNIEAHYDLGNDFYAHWLDSTMTYSSARFAEPGQDLAAAQANKYDALIHRLDLTPEHTVLEIGCGWGGFAEHAAKTVGCAVTGITISREQFDFARERIFRAGLAEKVDIQYCDYRDVTGRFDRIASIEMFEAVGEAYWPRFFGQVRDRLVEGGRAGLQLITIRDDYFEDYRRSADFIQKYVFPGGMLPSPSVLARQVREAGLAITDTMTFGVDYADTLSLWHKRFLDVWPEIHAMGFDERFRRLWTYYFAYCEAGFRAGSIDVAQVRLERI